jgi:hypothetical protein
MLASRRHCRRGISQGQTPEEVRGSLRLAACGEERPRVRLEQPDPRRDVARVPEIAVNRELSAQEPRAQFGHQFLCSVRPLAEGGAQITIQPRPVPSPVSKLVKRHTVEVGGAFVVPRQVAPDTLSRARRVSYNGRCRSSGIALFHRMADGAVSPARP